ncbi:DUF6924 domain-containing protein [Streptomyces sp. NPDC059340]|uniref:DUF6924 domain-containing protein n=1 Tax=Streptomyces sp. NPDC059340 TaxID=3346806 RepID=UPI0036852ECE
MPWGPGDFEPRVHVVDDPSWAGLTTPDLLAAVSADDELAVVFLADGVALRTGQGAPPAVSRVGHLLVVGAAHQLMQACLLVSAPAAMLQSAPRKTPHARRASPRAAAHRRAPRGAPSCPTRRQ